MYYPRVRVVLRVPLLGSAFNRSVQAETRDTFTFDVSAEKVAVSMNDPDTADEARLTLAWDEAGVDPRLLGNANIEIYAADAGDAGPWIPKPSDRVFLGIVCDVECLRESDSIKVEILARDYLTLFLAQKPLAAEGIPSYTNTLTEAWRLICAHVGYYDYIQKRVVSTVELLSDTIEFRASPDRPDVDVIIGEFALERVARMGQLQVDRKSSDAWGVWRRCCDSLGLMTWIDGDSCVVATPKAYFEEEDDPIVFRWGDNISSMKEKRDLTSINGRGIHMTGFDSITYSTIEAFFPPRDGSLVPVRKRLPAQGNSKKAKAAAASLAEIADYEHMAYPYSATQESLELVAERVWHERSRQELVGELKTTEMVIYRASGEAVSIFDITHGDPILVSTDDDVAGEMRSKLTVSERMAFLIEKGINPDKARLLAEDAGFLSKLLSVFVIRSVDWELSDGNFSATITYVSRINPNNGSTD